MSKTVHPSRLPQFASRWGCGCLAILAFGGGLLSCSPPREDASDEHQTSVGALLTMNPQSPDHPLRLTPASGVSNAFLLNYSLPQPQSPHEKLGDLYLIDNGMRAITSEITRQSNGTYLVQWDTRFAADGTHVLRVALVIPPGKKILGPERSETITNPIQFDPSSTAFGHQVCITATLQMQRVNYRIEFYDSKDALVNTIEGHTDNGLIDAVWNLKTPAGTTRKDETFQAHVFIQPRLGDASQTTNFLGPFPISLLRVGAIEP